MDGVNDYTCHCPPQWMGKNCSQVYNACTFLQPCQNNATCSTTPPQQDYSCACVSGFTGRDCETNIDDCVGHTCQAFEQCYDGINTYTCACPIGEDRSFLQCYLTSTARFPGSLQVLTSSYKLNLPSKALQVLIFASRSLHV